MKILELFEQGTTAPAMGTTGVSAPSAASTVAPNAVVNPSAQSVSDPRFTAAQAAADKKQREAQKQDIMKQIADLQKQLAALSRTV